MTNFDPALGLDGEGAAYCLDVRRGLLHLPKRAVPVVFDDEMWTRDFKRSIVETNFGLVPVIPLGGA